MGDHTQGSQLVETTDDFDLDKVSLGSDEFIRCPYQLYQQALPERPVLRDPDVGVAVLGYDAVADIAKRPEEFSSEVTSADGQGPRHMGISDAPIPPDVQALLDQYHDVVPALFAADAPAHTGQRQIVLKALSPRRVRQLEPKVREIANELIDRFIEDGTVEFNDQFTMPLPLAMISDILGVDREDMQEFKHWSDEMLAGNMEVLSDDRRREVAGAVIKFHKYFLERIDARRQEPREDLLGWLVDAELKDGRKLTDAELLPIISQILLAGHETQTFVMTGGLLALLRDPELLTRIRGDMSLLAPFFEEMLRFDPPVVCTFRRATRDTEINGLPVKEGELVMPMWGASGWDPEVFPNPETFDIDRPNLKRHQQFGYGPHFCVGSELARMNLRVAFEVLLERVHEIELDEQASDLTPLPVFALHGYKKLVVRFRPGPRVMPA